MILKNKIESYPAFIQVGSSTYSDTPGDVDIIAIVEKVTIKEIGLLKEVIIRHLVQLGFNCSKNQIELRHGPFKKSNSDGIPIHLLIHTEKTLQSVELATRLNWYLTIGWTIGVLSPKNLFLFEDFTRKEVIASIIREFHSVIETFRSNNISYKSWVEEKYSTELRVAYHQISNNDEKTVFLHHVISLLRFCFQQLKTYGQTISKVEIAKIESLDDMFENRRQNFEDLSKLQIDLFFVCRNLSKHLRTLIRR